MKSKTLKKIWNNKTEIAPMLALLGIALLIYSLDSTFLSLGNIRTLLVQSATMLVLGIGQTLVVLLGGIDLSVASVASWTGVLTALLLPVLGVFVFPVALIAGLFAGFLNGITHVKLRIPSFIVTLGAMGIWEGLAYVLTDGQPVAIHGQSSTYLTWITGRIGPIPNVVLLALGTLLVFWFVTRRTTLGRKIYLIGGGERAARLSGISTGLTKVLAFTLCGGLAGFAGIILSARLTMGSPGAASNFLLFSIAVVVMGGTALTGGSGGILRTLIGVLILAVIRNGIVLLGLNVFTQQLITGIVIISAVIVTINREKIPIIK